MGKFIPKVSIIIPVYNVEAYLPKCLDSVANQTLKDIEIICIDDCSTDSSYQILQEYAAKDERFIVLKQETNKNQGAARNRGIKIAKGEFIGFIDSDDWIEPETYENAYKIATEYNADLVNWCANIVIEDKNDNRKIIKSAISYHKIKLSGLYDWDYKLFKKTTVTVWNKLFKTSFIKKYDILFPENLRHEDDEFIAKYLFHCNKVYYLDKYYYNYLQRKNSSMDIWLKTNSRLDLLEIYQNLYSHCIKYNVFEQNKELLNIILNSTFYSAYMNSYNKKLSIKKMKKLAKILDNKILQNKNLDLIQNNKIRKIFYIEINTFWENIFSVKNVNLKKQITVLGIKFQFRNKKLEERERLKRLEQKVDKLSKRLTKIETFINAQN